MERKWKWEGVVYQGSLLTVNVCTSEEQKRLKEYGGGGGGEGGTVLKDGIAVHTWMTQHICSFFLNHQIFYLDTTIVCCGLCLK